MKLVNKLLLAGLFICICVPNNMQAMHFQHGKKKNLITHEADANEPLHKKRASINKLLYDTAASLEGERIDIIREALDADADIETTGSNCRSTSLIVASTRGYKDTVEELLTGKANVNAQNKFKYTALGQAAYTGNTAIASLLLDYNAMIDPVDADGTTPLMSAIAKPHIPMIELLLERKADVNKIITFENDSLYCDPLRGETALHFACYFDSPAHEEAIRLLIFAGADPASSGVINGYCYKGKKLTGSTKPMKHVINKMVILKEKIFAILEEQPWLPGELLANDNTLLNCLGSIYLAKTVSDYTERHLLDDYTESLVKEVLTKRRKKRTLELIEYEQQADQSDVISAAL